MYVRCLRNNLMTVTALLLALLPLLAGRPGLVWRSADGWLCAACTFAISAVADDCCADYIRVAAADNCRECCTADEQQQESRRNTFAADTLVALPPPTTTPAPLLRAHRLCVVTPSFLPIQRTFLHGPPGLRAPPPSLA